MGVRVAPRCAGSTPVQCTPTIRPLSREEVEREGTGGSTPVQCTPTIRPLSREEVVQVRVRVGPCCAGSTPVQCTPTIRPPSKEEVIQVRVSVSAVHTHKQASVEGRGGTGGGKGGSTLCSEHPHQATVEGRGGKRRYRWR